MMVWNERFSDFLTLAPPERWRWLADLLYHVTTMARVTFVPGQSGVSDPVRLRLFSEAAHRISQQLRGIAYEYDHMPDDVFALAMGEELERLGLDPGSFEPFAQLGPR